jgi:hypothetical protein
VYIYKPRCGLWSCQYCAHENKRQWAARIAHGVSVYQAQGFDAWVFVTLTAHEDRRTFEDSRHDLWESWPLLRTARRKRTRGKILYARVPERHKDGTLHLHMITHPSMGRKWWKDAGRKRGLGYMADEASLHDPALAAWYVSKYIAKGLTEGYWPHDLRRITTSAHWPHLPDSGSELEVDQEVDQWERMFTILSSEELSQWYQAAEGVSVTVLGKGWARDGAVIDT